MITKKRLKELIKQGATVWSNGWNEEVDLSKVCKTFYNDFGRYIIQVYEDEEYQPQYSIDNLEEDVETAKFKYRYQNIFRIETLSLPTWEEFIKKDKDRMKFIAKNGIRYSLTCYIDLNTILIFCDGSAVFDKELTKANYIEACELCKKLFLGEVE